MTATKITYQIDWLAGTVPHDTGYFLPDVMNVFEDWVTGKPLKGYDNVVIHKPTQTVMAQNTSRDDMGTHVRMSGESLQYVRALGVDEFDVIAAIRRETGHLTRLDLAIDVNLPSSWIKRLYEQMSEGKAETRVRTYRYMESSTGNTLYVGSRSSETFLRIYDKAGQLGIGGDLTRIELEFKSKRADSVGGMILESDDVGALLLSLLRGHVDFVEDSDWVALMGEVGIQKVATDNVDRGTRKWVMETVPKAVARWLATQDVSLTEQFWNTVRDLIIEERDKSAL